MSNDEGIMKSEAWKRVRSDFSGFVNSVFRRHSSFALRHLASTHRYQASREAAPARSHQKLPALHHLFAVEPDVEIAADAIDVRFRNPIGAGVFGVRMTEGDMHAGNFFVLQNMADNTRAGCVCADGKLAYAIAVFIRARVSAKFIAQILVL